ncbi:MAG: flavin reductase [Rhodococcus sp. (in: high G+C Gram-positive bacteria)]|nr:MAG: flavin reductase [Rhodococcus sp. (in: high G+C Gram-positive bacteria)]
MSTPPTADGSGPLDAHRFKESMARVTGPVAIVTAVHDGAPHGTTVSSLASLSMSPAMITVALDNGSALLAIVRETGAFGVNVLSARQHEAAMRFASRRDDRFAGVAWEFADGLPRLTGSSAWLRCAVSAEIPGGDHTLLLGTVRDCSTSDATPLVYSRRTFGTHAALPELTGAAS